MTSKRKDMGAEPEILMAAAFGAAVGATKRQIQHWTALGIIRPVQGTLNQGTGNKVLYDASEIPAARCAAWLSANGVGAKNILGMVNRARERGWARWPLCVPFQTPLRATFAP